MPIQGNLNSGTQYLVPGVLGWVSAPAVWVLDLCMGVALLNLTTSHHLTPALLSPVAICVDSADCDASLAPEL